MTVDPAAADIHDRITQAYLGELGERFMKATQERLHWISAQVKGDEVLDIGCSQGIGPILLARAGHRVTGVDIDSKVISEARAYLEVEPKDVQDRVRFLHADAADLPVEGAYDTVVLGEILEHLEDPGHLIEIAANHLAPGGRLVVTVPFGIHDWPDHRQTFYCGEPYRLMSQHFSVIGAEIIDRWIGFVAIRAPAVATEEALSESVLLARAESGFLTLECRLRNEIKIVRRRLSAAEAARKAAEQATAAARAEAERVAAAAKEEAARADAKQAEAERAADEALEVARLRIERLREDYAARARRAARVTEALLKRLRDVETSESFRFGHAVALAVTWPRRALSGKRRSRRSDADAILPDALAGGDRVQPLPLYDLMEGYDAGGPEAVVAALRDAVGADPTMLCPALVQAARALAQAGIPEAEYPLVTETVRIERSDATLRALYWAAQRAGDLRTAWGALREIEALYGPQPTATQKKFLAKMRSGPIVEAELLEAIHRPGLRVFKPAAGRIAYVLHNSLPYSSGGYATRAHGLALGLTATGFDLVCLSRPGFPRDTKPELLDADLPPEDVIDGIRYLRADRPLRDESTGIAKYVREAAEVMEAQFRTLRPEIVIAASAYLSALPAAVAARRLGLPFIYEVRGFWEITRISRNPALEQSAFFRVQRLLEAEIAKSADHVFTLTGPMRAELIERGVPGEKITLLPNSCDPERFTPRPRDVGLAARLGIPEGVPVIGYIGTFVQYEGLDDLARACALLKARGHVFRLMLVGNENTSGAERGPITAEIERVAAEEGLADWLILPGRVPHSEVEAYYSLIDVAPFPRKPQPVTEMVSPMKPLEALAMEKAVVVSSVRALAEMIRDGETGLVFAKGDVESLADVLARAIGDAGLRARLGAAGRVWVTAERTWDRTAAAARTEIDRVFARSAEQRLDDVKEGAAAALPLAFDTPARTDAFETFLEACARDKGRSLNVKVRKFGQSVRTRNYAVSFEGAHSGWDRIEIEVTPADGQSGVTCEMALFFGALSAQGEWLPFVAEIDGAPAPSGASGLASLRLPLKDARRLELTTPQWPRDAARLWICAKTLTPGPFVDVASRRVASDGAADFGRATASRIEALAARDRLAEAETLLYADIDLNVIDGSSVWLSSMASMLARHRRVVIVSKRDIATDVIVANIENADRVTIVEPKHLQHVRPHFDLDEAVELIRRLDAACPRLRSVFVRGVDAASMLLADRQFDGRVHAYLTDFYEIDAHGVRVSEERSRQLAVIATHARRILVQTPFIAARLREATGLEFDTLELPPAIPDDLPLRPHRAPESPLRIGYAGKIAPDWGVRELFDWVETLRAEGLELELTIIGNKISGPKTRADRTAFRAEMLRRMDELDVVRHEQLTRAEALARLGEANFVWCWRPGAFENATLELSTKLVEGVASGFACICFPSATNRELLGEEYPFFAEGLDDVRRLLRAAPVPPPQAVVQACRARHSFTTLANRIDAVLPDAAPKAAPRICFAGHDFKFIDPYISRLKRGGLPVIRDLWGWGQPTNLELSRARLAEADVVFCEWGLGNAVWYSNNLPPDKRLLVRIHRQEVSDRARALVSQINPESVERFIFVSGLVRDMAADLYGWPEEKMQIIPNFVLEDEYKFQERSFEGPIRLGMVGIVPWLKRLDRALDVLITLRLAGHSAELHIKGPRPESLPYMWAPGRREELALYEAQIARMRHDPDLERAVTFHPPGNDVAHFYRTIDHILSPSDFESFHYALADGVLSGCHPVVWSRPEADVIYDPGWLVESIDQAASSIIDFRALPVAGRAAALKRNRALICSRYGAVRIFQCLDNILLKGHLGRGLHTLDDANGLARSREQATSP